MLVCVCVCVYVCVCEILVKILMGIFQLSLITNLVNNFQV